MENLGFDIPAFGLVLFKKKRDTDDVEYAFIIKRYDRDEKTDNKIHQEQLDGAMGVPEKYGNVYSMQAISYESVCQFLINNLDTSLVFKRDLFTRIMYAYLLGNNDLHLRNFGIVMPEEEKNSVAPIYDFVSAASYSATCTESFLALPLLKTEEVDDFDLLSTQYS
jgi:serine/threonine-protein kinase HipA